ncbi:MAG: hypothetical protein ABWK53_00290 [Anaerolineales bacterium]
MKKIFFVITHFNFWAPIEPVAREYIEKGHEVRLLIDRQKNRKFEGRYSFGICPPYQIGNAKSRSDGLQLILHPLRELISFIAYLKFRQPTSPVLVKRWMSYIPFIFRWIARTERGARWLASDGVWRFLRKWEAAIPTDWGIRKQLRKWQPDVLVAASAILPYSKETDYLKAAGQLKIPTVLIVPSWDNLTTKGTLHVIPDWVFVWNRGQVKEAVDLHFVPEERTFCTGAPKFDPWFEIQPTVDRDTFCSRARLAPNKPYVLYVCSSEFIAGDETDLVNQIARAMKEHPILKDLSLLVRPHPQNMAPWTRSNLMEDNIVVWSGDLEKMNAKDTMMDFYHSLFYSIAVIGVNTSAFIEAAIVDKPCIAISADRYTYTQMGIPHFHHLVDADFLEIPQNLDELMPILSGILRGEDRKKENRYRFVKNFVRPQGIDVSATEILARAIENVANGKRPDFSSEEDRR